MPDIISKLYEFSSLDYAVMTINLLLFIFSGPIVSGFNRSSDSKSKSGKLWALRAINVILFVFYISALFITDIIKQISLTGLSLLMTFLVSHFLQLFVLSKFGRSREIDGTEYHTETYQSEVFSLLVNLVAMITVIVIIINIWDLTDWLKATSVLGVLALILFSTKDVWAPDNINGLIILYNGDIEPGSVIRVDELGLLAITVQTSLSQTLFRDLKTRHVIILPNSRLRNTKIEILSKNSGSGLLQFTEFNLEYGVTSSVAEGFLRQVWERACEVDSSINPEREPSIKLINTGDHAVTWRLGYWLKNVYSLCETELAVKRTAYDLSLEQNIKLETPLTHVIIDNDIGPE